MKTPWHLWLIGILALLWNAGGAFDFVMTFTRNESYMSSFTPEQLDFFTGFPKWVIACWAVAVWGALLGSILLLLRSGHAVFVFALSILGMAGTIVYSHVLSGVDYIKLIGTGPLWFSVAIAVVAILLYLYARAMRQRKVLS